MGWMQELMSWLLEADNPGVRARTLVGLRNLPLVDHFFSQRFDVNCDEMRALRALVMLGYGTDPRLCKCLDELAEYQLPVDGWLCLHRLDKLKRTSKSCIKAAMHGLLLAGELKKRAISFPGSNALVEYFLKRRLFYRMDDSSKSVLDYRPGYRMTDIHFPIEFMRLGLPVLLNALAALGASQGPEPQEAWSLLASRRDWEGRVILQGTLNKTYLPKERVGKLSKWATLYACLAWKHTG